MYGFTPAMVNANYMTSKLEKVLPPTDSRRRPDQRALEFGDLKLATSEKNRLEDKQRLMKKQRDKNKIVYKPAYFDEEKNEYDGITYFKYNNKYFEHDRPM